MALSFGEKLRNHSQISLIHGLGLAQKVRPLMVSSSVDPSAREFLKVMQKEAYKLGVPHFDVAFDDPELLAEQFRNAPGEMRLHIPEHVRARAEEAVRSGASPIRIDGNDSIGLYEGIDKSIPPAYGAKGFKMRESMVKIMMGMHRPWHVCAAATENWAKALNMSVDELWNHIFACSGADRVDALKYVESILKKLQMRCEILNKMKIRSLSFENKGGALYVGLSPLARWFGGSRQADDGTWFAPNWPTAESWTTPDWHMTRGNIRATKTLSIDGTIVKDLELQFDGGRIVDMHASEGIEAFRSLVNVDAGASQLGEIALVDINSPIAQRKLVFLEILFDENAANHFAIGKAYPAAIEGSAQMSPEELEKIGCNVSNIHRDIMISDEKTWVIAHTYESKVIELQVDGSFVGELAKTA